MRSFGIAANLIPSGRLPSCNRGFTSIFGEGSQYKLEVIGAYICAVFIFDEEYPFLSFFR